MRAWTVGMVAVAGAATLGITGTSWSQLVQPRSISMLRDATGSGGASDGWTPALFVCDGTNRDRVIALTAPDRSRRARLTSMAKPGLTRTQPRSVTIGRANAGMNQIWYALSDAAGRVVGNIRTVNPGMVEPGATTPTVTSVTIGRETTNCRFAPQTRVLGTTAARSVQVTATDRRGYRYQSYDHDTNLAEIDRPWGGRDTRSSLSIDNGRLVERGSGRRIYEFRRAGYVYRVMASVDPARGGGGVQVLRDGRVVLSEPFGVYTAAVQP